MGFGYRKLVRFIGARMELKGSGNFAHLIQKTDDKRLEEAKNGREKEVSRSHQ